MLLEYKQPTAADLVYTQPVSQLLLSQKHPPSQAWCSITQPPTDYKYNMKVTDLLENQDSSLWTKVKDAMKGGSPVPDKVKYGDTAYPTANKPKQQSVKEAPIEMDPSEPNNPRIYGHEKANSMTLKGRIMSARAQLKELAELAESDDLVAWEKITRLAKGGMFMGLEQNLEQIRHGIGELAAKRRKGGVQSRGIDRNIGEQGVAKK